MKIEITYNCGHTGMVELRGSAKKQASTREWLMNRCECPDCKTLVAEADADRRHLPKLYGSEKQIRWALRIRQEKMVWIGEYVKEIAGCAEYCPSEKTTSDFHVARDAYMRIASERSASWWIDHRNVSAESMLNDALEDIAC